ncbi:methyltransferase [Phyllobacterium brassicacearum]|uniref:Methyltransferase n=1 Tax=Phyllobacterium brassicacearum TaxID=314235 RepID=A0A2P7BT20_9HYPH|nr:class I SAM-dependent methyltransferase [Phyllobacterium brassicacearum]PSH69616.1 methyltransferase [Phyllobacterium brassicacearum]TDQ30449.1 SAM-dependent MidA family methyltransferase [Phyllobacterium brassicacearum]
MNLKQRIIRQIETTGPISVAEYMAMCLFDRDAGYYTTREPFGKDGDFVTAPEVSQMFGELVGVWCVNAWQALGAPDRFILCEMGPGRGTLMKDLIRATSKLAPGFIAAAKIHMVEISERLTEIQQTTLDVHRHAIEWNKQFSDIGSGPLVFVANELFDAIPTRQYVKINNGFVERMLAFDTEKNLVFVGGSGPIDQTLLPPASDIAPQGSIFEISPARSALMQEIAGRIHENRGAALLFDYGHLQQGFGDTLQALSRHTSVDVLHIPGSADLTTHVDFYSLAQAARAEGCKTSATTQGEFLVAMGLLDRAGALGQDKSGAIQDQIHADVERLAGPDQMGTLFKALCVTDPATHIFPFEAK